jgi:hypothetical protein
MEMAAAGAFTIIIGTRKGETFRAPPSTYRAICSSSVPMPPTPVASSTPRRRGSPPTSPAWSIAWTAAASASWVTRSVRRASFGFGMTVAGSKPCTRRSPSGGAAQSPSQNASTPVPHEASTPSPVTATRRPSI